MADDPFAPLRYDAPLEAYESQADALREALAAGADEARWAVKWEHPRFRGRPVDEVDPAALDLEDARIVVARRYGFETWADLEGFTRALGLDPAIARFEGAAEAVVSGDLDQLRSYLRDDPDLARARSSRRHRATLLHYVAANGVEQARQKTPESALEIARALLAAGAEVDALADMYDTRCATLGLLVSSDPPAKAGLQTALAELLVDHGAALEGEGAGWPSALMTALKFGFPATAQALVRRGAKVDALPAAAGLGRLDDAERLLPAADAASRHAALALAAQLGHVPVVRLLLDAGEDPDRFNPEGFHAHATPLHQAVWSDHRDVVRLLVTRGARLDMKDTLFSGTPLDWAVYGGRAEIAEELRAHGAPGRSEA